MLMIEDFLNYLRYERNRSDLTVSNYERSLCDFESYFKNRESHLSWESVDSDLIRDWMESMMDKGDMASTVDVPFFVLLCPGDWLPMILRITSGGRRKRSRCRSLFARATWTG